MGDEGRDVDIDSDGDKKAHHNALERKRRDHIKDSFTGLRDCVPSLHGEKASRALILKKAAEYIHHMRKRNNSHQHDIENLKKQNGLLEIQIRSLEKTRNVDEHYGSNYNSDSAAAIITNTKGTAVSAFDGGSGSESSDSDKQITRHNSSSSSSSSSAMTNKAQQHSQGGASKRKKLKTNSTHSSGS